MAAANTLSPSILPVPLQNLRMPCLCGSFCGKLLARQYSNTTPNEVSPPTSLLEEILSSFAQAQILRRTWEEAAYLFQAVLPTPPSSTSPNLPSPNSTLPNLSPPNSTSPNLPPPNSTLPSPSPAPTIEHLAAQTQSTRERDPCSTRSLLHEISHENSHENLPNAAA